jgi:hypothetical protein
MTLGGTTVELVRADNTHIWHPRSDDGTTVDAVRWVPCGWSSSAAPAAGAGVTIPPDACHPVWTTLPRQTHAAAAPKEHQAQRMKC